MKTLIRRLTMTALAATLVLPIVLSTTGVAAPNNNNVQHVLLISVDGMHQVDLQLWVKSHPNGTLAALAKRGTTYSQAYTTSPSDSFPGMLAQVTGGTPYSTGVFYDDSYERTFYPPSSNCVGAPGAETTYAENLDYNLNNVTGGGLSATPCHRSIRPICR